MPATCAVVGCSNDHMKYNRFCWPCAGRINASITCRDCGVLVDLYMVHDELWERFVPECEHDMTYWLCISCLGQRRGSPITLDDLNDAPCNEKWKETWSHGPHQYPST